MYRAALIGGFFEAEIVGKALVVGGAVTEGVAFARLTSRIDIEQLGGGISHLFGSLFLGFFPLPAA